MITFTIKTAWNQYGQLMGNVLGHDRESLERDYAQYQIIQPAASVKDYMWGLFNRMLLETAGDYIVQSGIYHAMGVFVTSYEGKNGKKYKRLSLAQEVNTAQIESKQSPNLIWELEVIADPDCEHAKSFDGTRFPITDDLVLPLANEDCYRDLCRCTTCRVAKRDESGRIIFTNRMQTKQRKKRFWRFW